MDVSVSKEGLDPEWDRFLETLPDNCYQQSSLWAAVKAASDWKQLRLVVREHRQIIGGAQILFRPLPLLGAVGYVSKGPVVVSDEPAVQEFILDQLDRVARAERILFLKVQPAYGAENLAQKLVERDAQPSTLPVTGLATLRIDLRPDPDDILAQMKRNGRRTIRRTKRSGVSVRQGTEDDIPTLVHLREVHSRKRGYGSGSEAYYRRLWSIFGRDGHFCLLLAEYDGQILGATTCIAFGDVLLGHHLVSNDLHRELNAPRFLLWKAMLWGKRHGYAWYDFGDLPLSLARAIRDGRSLPDTDASGRAQFKLSFGGQLLFRPGVYDISYVWPNRLTARMIPALIKMRPLLSFLIGRSLGKYTWRMNQALAQLDDMCSDSNQLEGS